MSEVVFLMYMTAFFLVLFLFVLLFRALPGSRASGLLVDGRTHALTETERVMKQRGFRTELFTNRLVGTRDLPTRAGAEVEVVLELQAARHRITLRWPDGQGEAFCISTAPGDGAHPEAWFPTLSGLSCSGGVLELLLWSEAALAEQLHALSAQANALVLEVQRGQSSLTLTRSGGYADPDVFAQVTTLQKLLGLLGEHEQARETRWREVWQDTTRALAIRVCAADALCRALDVSRCLPVLDALADAPDDALRAVVVLHQPGRLDEDTCARLLFVGAVQSVARQQESFLAALRDRGESLDTIARQLGPSAALTELGRALEQGVPCTALTPHLAWISEAMILPADAPDDRACLAFLLLVRRAMAIESGAAQLPFHDLMLRVFRDRARRERLALLARALPDGDDRLYAVFWGISLVDAASPHLQGLLLRCLDLKMTAREASMVDDWFDRQPATLGDAVRARVVLLAEAHEDVSVRTQALGWLIENAEAHEDTRRLVLASAPEQHSASLERYVFEHLVGEPDGEALFQRIFARSNSDRQIRRVMRRLLESEQPEAFRLVLTHKALDVATLRVVFDRITRHEEPAWFAEVLEQTIRQIPEGAVVELARELERACSMKRYPEQLWPVVRACVRGLSELPSRLTGGQIMMVVALLHEGSKRGWPVGPEEVDWMVELLTLREPGLINHSELRLLAGLASTHGGIRSLQAFAGTNYAKLCEEELRALTERLGVSGGGLSLAEHGDQGGALSLTHDDRGALTLDDHA